MIEGTNSCYIIYQGDIKNALKNNGIEKYAILNEQLAIVYIPVEMPFDILNNIFEVSWWSYTFPISSLMEVSNNLVGGENVTVASGTDYIYKNPYIKVSGEGILIAIIDSGIDYLHPDFIYSNGTSKIVNLWDQESEIGNPPQGLLFGSEFTRDDINKAIIEKNGNLSVDSVGTGTLASGVVASLGNKNTRHKGVAIGAELIVVKLKEYKDKYHVGRINYSFTDFLMAVKHVLKVAKKEKKPLILNLTVGSRSSEYTDVTILDTFKDLRRSGVVVVGGGGNEGNTDIHYSGKFNNLEEVNDIMVQIDDDINIDLVLSGKGIDKIGLQIISPAGEVSTKVLYSPDFYVYRGKFNIENATYAMRSIYPFISSGSERIEIQIKNVKSGVWILRLFPEFIVTGGYSVYLPNKNLIGEKTRFLNPQTESTITRYSNSTDVITVGAFNDKTDSMWINSSKGAIERYALKPDIVAPGVDIISTYLNSTYNSVTGTGVSSSIVAGAIALLMEYLIEQSDVPRLGLYSEVLKSYLMIGATKNPIFNYPNNFQGYGILDLKNTIQQIANNL